jgi:hypothetical protein
MNFFHGQTLESWLNPKLELKESSIQGKGLVAQTVILAGEVVLVWGGTVFSADEIREGKTRICSAAILREGLYLADPIAIDDCPDYYLNHSCDPNVWMRDELTMIARRNIPPGQEITADYALWEMKPDWVLALCKCGSKLCRGNITGNDWRRADLRERYKGHFIPYINQKIESEC